MFSKFVWLFLLLAPLRGQQTRERQWNREKKVPSSEQEGTRVRQCNREKKVPSSEQEGKARQKIRSYFEDVSELNELCQNSSSEFCVNICEMECGKRRDNRNGRLLVEGKTDGHENAPHLLVPKEESHERQGRTKKSFRGRNLRRRRVLPTCPIYGHYYRNRRDDQFDKTIRFLVTDPDFVSNDLPTVEGVLEHFNYCTENMVDFKIETHPISTDLSGMNWMQATYKVLTAAVEMGIDLSLTESDDGGHRKIKFDTGGHMTMIFLPDDVDFEECYGFGALHYGLSVLKSSDINQGKNILHEIGHNLGLKHSSSQGGDEYGDDKCFMGNQQNKGSCFNGAKSYYLGLYMEHTAVLRSDRSDRSDRSHRRDRRNRRDRRDRSEEPCNAVLTIADTKDHLDKNITTDEKYYVLAYVRIKNRGNIKRAYVMYYKDDDIVVVTDGGLGDIDTNDGGRIQYADVSHRIFDLKENDSDEYEGVLIKRCPSSGVAARVLISFDPDAQNECN